MMRKTHSALLIGALLLARGLNGAQSNGAQQRRPESPTAELRLRLASTLPGDHHAASAVVWLEALPGTPSPAFVPQRHYTLLQKNRTFIPHLLIIPVGSAVEFPNRDPFFHNVFSLYEGKRFDLGLYEAGSSKSVTFPRSGVSYIFCNIHPEMSAVVVALSTPLYAVADAHDAFILSAIPAGDYRFHIWIEGVPQSVLRGMEQTLHFDSRMVDLGTLKAAIASPGSMSHPNKFGSPYGDHPGTTY